MNKTKILIAAFAALAMISCSNNSSLCPDENHPHKIDLGLPSRTLWSCCNVGATSPEDAGGYYAWGETNIKSSYGPNNYDYPGYINDISGTEFDVAHTQWGDTWQMPTSEQIYELLLNCDKKWTTIRGSKGYLFTGNNGKSIFIPAAGYVTNSRSGSGEVGYLWSSIREDLDDDGMIRYSRCLAFHKNWMQNTINMIEAGLNIRPISSY